jgi:ribonuclease HII
MQPDFTIENEYSHLIVSGIDEAGRGPLAGPVVAACVILNQNDFTGKDANALLSKINDSKKLSKIQRGKIFIELQQKVKFGIGIVDEKIIDDINILQATKLAMLRSFLDLQKKYQIFPNVILIDGNVVPFEKENLKEKNHIQTMSAIVKGDQKSLSIAAASIIAKETRDGIMKELHAQYPDYGFDKHAGYPTKFHIDQIKKLGICQYHRTSFEPIKSLLT